ncbi:staphylopine family metallophore export MFS transporter CntE [Paenibacillus daejeonensis]|uniref:staphylopine family metallophore export MFS transporter CntE n=1 Tax=Paenibacillus daejeonensis TaxID=135193 RepID=UPI00036266C9|nr:MFS transporter [Paenibacillus daejeonensis]
MRNRTQLATSWPFVRLYMLAFLFFSANSILNVILPLRSESMGASNTMIGLIMGTYMLTCMVFRPWAGHIVRKYGAVRVLRLLLIANGAAILLYTVSGLEGFFAARLIQGIATAFFSMALQMGIIDALPEEERSQGVSLYSLSTYMPAILGPLAALGIWEWGGMNGFAATMMVIAVATGLFGFRTSIQPARLSQTEEEAVSKAGPLRQLIRQPAFVTSSLLMLMASMVFGAVAVFIPLYAGQIAWGNAGVYLMIQAGVIVLSRFALRRRVPSDGRWHPGFIQGILLLAGVAALMLALAPSAGPWLLYTAAVLMGIAQALLYPTLTTYLTFVLPAASRNVLIGLFIASADLGISLGGMALGPVADALSYSAVYAVCCGLMVAASVTAWISGRALTVRA